MVRNETWAETIEELRSGEVDAVPIASRTPERDAFLVFGRPYVVYPAVILVRQGTKLDESLEAFGGKRVAVPQGYAAEEYVRGEYPEVEVDAHHRSGSPNKRPAETWQTRGRPL